MGSKSKIKGSTWEREICSILGEHLGGTFFRTSGSGSFVGGKNTIRKQYMSEAHINVLKGDITTPEHLTKLVIEAKNYNEIAFHQFFTECKQLDGWINQLEETLDDGDYGILIFKITRKGSYIAVPKKYTYNLQNYTVYNNYIITDFHSFIKDNIEIIKKLSN